VKRLREVHGMYVAGGQDHLKGKIFRVGHMGSYDLADIHAILGALDECVAALGAPGVKTAEAPRALSAASLAWQEA
jgi:aspartate aminotransferase-like enzyme